MVSRPPGLAWLRQRSVRAMTTAGACLVVGLALLLGGLILAAALRTTLVGQAESTAKLRAQGIADLLASGTAPSDLVLVDDEDWSAQVIAPDGTVVASSPRLAGIGAQADPGTSATFIADRTPHSDGCPCQVVVRPAAGGYWIVAAQTLDPATEGVQVLGWVLAGGIPVLLLVVGATTWHVVDRALRPVEAIRDQVARISDSALTRRVPQPPGHDEIARLATTMNDMLDRLQAARDRQRRFISDASHELRSPIATIRHGLELAAAHPTDTDVTLLADDLLVESQRLQRLVEDLLLLARADEGSLAPRQEFVDLDDVLLAEGVRLRVHNTVRLDTTGIHAAQVYGDGQQLTRMIRNLTDNALRHARSRIMLAVRPEGDQVRLTVANDGPPIAASDRERIFERFTRLDEDRGRTGGGAGLGLAIVAAIVAAHAGTVRVSSAAGDTAFTVILPATPGCSKLAEPDVESAPVVFDVQGGGEA